MGIGTDIAKISRFIKLSKDEAFMNKVFNHEEIDYFSQKKFNPLNIAGSFCAKEAVAKAIGTGFRGFSLKDIKVLRDSLGKPCIVISDKLKEIALSCGVSGFDLSISHDGDYAVATVVSQTDKNYLNYKKSIKKSDVLSWDIITNKLAKEILPKRKPNSHKGDFGKAFIVAGSTGLTGAAVLSAKACLKSGAGLITLGIPQSLNMIFETALFEVMTLPLEDVNGVLSFNCVDKIVEKTIASDCVLFGPGLSRHKDIFNILDAVLKNANSSVVIDADGINALSKNINVLTGHKEEIVLTPHLVEFTRISEFSLDDLMENLKECALSFAKKHGVVLVLKSHQTVVALPDGRIFTNVLGNSGMATGGSGDVLSGIITAFLAQGISADKSALLGVYVHSLAADMASCDIGEYSLTPSDIISYLPYALKYLEG